MACRCTKVQKVDLIDGGCASSANNLMTASSFGKSREVALSRLSRKDSHSKYTIIGMINIFYKHFKSEIDLVIAHADEGKLPDFQSANIYIIRRFLGDYLFSCHMK